MSAEMFFVDDLVEKTRGLARDARLKHPFLVKPIDGAEAARGVLRATSAALDSGVVPWLEFAGHGVASLVWTSRTCGHEIFGVTVAVMTDDGYVKEVRIMLRELAAAADWRARLRDRMPDLPGWELPGELAQAYARAGVTGRGEPAGTPLPFPPSEDARFMSPALVKPVEGADSVRLVVGHARAIYGECEIGPALRNGAHALRTLTSKLPLEMASLSHLTANGSVTEMSVFMQPSPVVAVFATGMRARLTESIDPSYFELGRDHASRAALQE
jgi:hypothetical protein